MTEQRIRQETNSFATASLILGILSILSFCFLYGALMFGSLSIIFALLSRGASYKLPDKSIGGFAASAVGIVLSAIITAFSFFFLVRLFGWETVQDPEALMKAYTEFMNQFLTTGGSGL